MFGSFKRFVQAFALVLAWQLPTRARQLLPSSEAISLPWERRREEKKTQKILPKVRKRPPRRIIQRGGYRGTNSKDARYSNQQKLRRMYRNC